MIEAWLDEVCRQVRARQAHGRIREELTAHAEALREEYLRLGHAPEAAERAALARLGGAEALGHALDQVHRPRIDWHLVGASLALVGLGVAAVDSGRQAAWAAAGVALATALALVDYRRLRRAAAWLHPVTCIGLVALHLSSRWHGAKPFLPLGPLSVNLVDLSPLPLAVALAAVFSATPPPRLATRVALLVAPLAIYPTVGGLTSSVLYSMAFLTMLAASGASARMLAAFTATALAFGLWAAAATRLAAVALEPSAADLATDYVTSAIAARLGWTALAALPLCATLFVVRVARVGMRAREPFGALLAQGFAVLAAAKFAWSLATATHLLPLPESGLGVPLVSHEASLLVATLATVGLVISVERRRGLG